MTRKEGNGTFELTHHARMRMSQRGISLRVVRTILSEGRPLRKQGLRFFFLTRDQLRFHDVRMQEHLKNVMVVASGREDVVITVYRNRQAIGRVKRKNKRLAKGPEQLFPPAGKAPAITGDGQKP